MTHCGYFLSLFQSNSNAADARSSSIYIKKALRIFGRRTWYRNELARSKYKFGKVNEVLGRRLEAQQAFQEAYEIRSKIVPNDTRPMQELSEEDYDDLVAFWYR